MAFLKQKVVLILFCFSFPVMVFATDNSSIDYDGYVDFHKVTSNTPLRHRFRFKNVTQSDHELTNPVASCSCIQILSYSSFVIKQETGYIDIQIVPDKPGDFTFEIVLQTNDKQKPYYKFLIDLSIEKNLFLSYRRKIGQDFPPEFITRRICKKSNDFLINMKDLSDNFDNYLLVDVRNENRYREFRIPGSINIPIFSVKHKTFLHNKPVVIINEGFNYKNLIPFCKELRKIGFKIWILDGGLNFWIHNGGEVIGDVFAQKTTRIIPPDIFFVEKHFDNWIAIDVSVLENIDSPFLIPQSNQISFENNSHIFKNKIKSLIQKNDTNNHLPYLLIYNTNGEKYDLIAKKLSFVNNAAVFFLEGGLENYDRYLHLHALEISASDREKIKSDANPLCPSCPD